MTKDVIYQQKKNDIPDALPDDPKGWSVGEKLFDATAYIGFQGIANAAISMAFGDWVHNGWRKDKAGNLIGEAQQEKLASRKVYNFIYTGAEKLAAPLEPIFGKSQTIKLNGAVEYKGAINFTRRFMQGGVLGIGGWLMLPIVKKLEDNKVGIVNYFNRNLTEDTSDDHKTRAKLGDETKQTWIGLLGGRTVAFFLPITIGAALLEPLSKRTGEDFFETMSNFQRDKLGIKPEKFFRKMSVMRGKDWSYQLAGELFYTTIGVTTLYIVSKAISRAVGNGYENGETAAVEPALVKDERAILPATTVSQVTQQEAMTQASRAII